MGGVWTPPLKLVDGVWFGIGDQWVGPATRFRSGWGYTELDLPATAGLRVRRTDFAPDGTRAVLFGLRADQPGRDDADRDGRSVDAHSELMGAYPWGFSGVMPNASDNLPDTAAFDGESLVFRDQGTLPHPNAEPHDYAALVASDRRPAGGETGARPPRRPGQQRLLRAGDAEPVRRRPVRPRPGRPAALRGARPGRGTETLWVAVAGSDEGLDAARDELRAALAQPRPRAARRRSPRASELGGWTRALAAR